MAQAKHNIDLPSSCMVGDSLRDMACAQNAGCKSTILVRTGHGAEEEKKTDRKTHLPISSQTIWPRRRTGLSDIATLSKKTMA